VERPWSDLRSSKDTLQEEWVGGFHLFLVWCLCFEIIYLWWYFIKSLLNDETTMKCLIEVLMIVEMTMKCRLGSCWMLKQWWNINVLKWLVRGGYIIVLRWILNRLWDVDWAIMNLGCWWMVVWVLRRIYYCILFNVIVTNDCMSIM